MKVPSVIVVFVTFHAQNPALLECGMWRRHGRGTLQRRQEQSPVKEKRVAQVARAAKPVMAALVAAKVVRQAKAPEKARGGAAVSGITGLDRRERSSPSTSKSRSSSSSLHNLLVLFAGGDVTSSRKRGPGSKEVNVEAFPPVEAVTTRDIECADSSPTAPSMAVMMTTATPPGCGDCC